MKKLFVLPVCGLFLALIVLINGVFLPFSDFSTDILPEQVNNLANGANALPLEYISEDDAKEFAVLCVVAPEKGQLSSADGVLSADKNGKLSDSASKAKLMDATGNLLKQTTEVQANVITELVTTYKYKDNQITVFDGMGKGISASTDTLNEMINEKGKTVSFLAIRLNDGASIGYNVNDFYQSCSTIKVPVTLYAATLIDNGTLSANDKFTYNKSLYDDGSGIIKNAEYGTKYTVKKLIDYAIVDSDNIAYKMLCANLGITNIYDFIQSMGAEIPEDDISSRKYWLESNCISSAIWWMQVYKFKDSGETGKWYWELLEEAKSRIGTGIGRSKPCYTKTGSSDYCIHEAGIIGGDDPYLVVIYTRSSTVSGNDEYYFYDLAEEIDRVICSK